MLDGNSQYYLKKIEFLKVEKWRKNNYKNNLSHAVVRVLKQFMVRQLAGWYHISCTGYHYPNIDTVKVATENQVYLL